VGLGVAPAGTGVDVHFRDTKLRKALTLIQRVKRPSGGAVPVIAHRRHDGTWEVKRGHLKGGVFIIRTKRFSFELPTWLNPKGWVHYIGDRVAASVGGRTSPWACDVPAAQWFDVSNLTDTVHACGQNNPLPDGGARAEVRIKNNRGAVQEVTLAGTSDYTWVDGQPDAVRDLIAKATSTDAADTVFLAPGDNGMMTVGYRQPARDTEYALMAQTTWRSLFVNAVYQTLDWAGEGVTSRFEMAELGYVLAKCSGVVDLGSGTVMTGSSMTDFMGCMTSEAASELSDPKKALGVALQINDPAISKMDTKDFTAQLQKSAEKLKLLGEMTALRPALQQEWQGAADDFAALVTGGDSTHIMVRMSAPPPPRTAPSIAAPSTSAPSSAGSTGGPAGGSSPSGGGSSSPPPPAPTTRDVVVYNKVTNDAATMREDNTPAYLSSQTRNYCRTSGCMLAGTDMGSGAHITAVCQSTGDRTTNGIDGNAIDDANPGLFESTRWYGIRWSDGRLGYISEVWVEPGYRGGLGLPAC
jgi:hypothetical protein